jgi:hypothetical protein
VWVDPSFFVIFEPFDFGLNAFFQTKKALGSIKKPNSTPCTCYTLPNAKGCLYI